MICLIIPFIGVSQETGKFPYNKSWAYHTGTSDPEGLSVFFDNDLGPFRTAARFGTNWVLNDSSEFVFDFPRQTHFKLEKIKFFDGPGQIENPTEYCDVLAVRRSDHAKLFLGKFSGEGFNEWVEYKWDTTEISRVILKIRRGSGNCILPQEIQFLGRYNSFTEPAVPITKTSFNDHIGENFYPYDLQDPKTVNKGVDSLRGKQFRETLSTGRFYVDARWLEPYPVSDNAGKDVNKNLYTFQSSHLGGYRFDDILRYLKNAGIRIVFDVKEVPDDIRRSYSGFSKRKDVIPVFFKQDSWKKDILNPLKYDRIAKLVTELTLRYGRNKKMPLTASRQNTSMIHNSPVSVNQPKVGLDLLNVIEVGNENNKFWGGRAAYQTGYEYAAMLSACYDGHKGKLGPDIGIKVIDTTMLLAMNGLVGANPGYIRAMIDWCEENRGYRPDGSIDICWDIINWHMYTNDAGAEQVSKRTRGAAPETVNLHAKVLNIRRMGMGYLLGNPDPNSMLDTYLTEYGFDIGNTTQRAIEIPAVGKSREETQADWTLRTILMNMSLGVNFSVAYQYRDDAGAAFLPDGFTIDISKKANQYTSSGATLRPPSISKRPLAWIFQQVKTYFGDWKFDEMTGNQKTGYTREGVKGYNGNEPYIMRIFKPGTDSTGYVIWYGTEFGQTGQLDLNIKGVQYGESVDLDYYSATPKIQRVPVLKNRVSLPVSEKPLFIRFNSK